MDDVIVVRPKSRTAIALLSICNAVFRFFAYVGDSVLRFPNKLFYAVLVVLCVLSNVFAVFIVITLLCGAYGRQR
jgi:hypothetical protein